MASPELVTGEPAPLPSGLISHSPDIKWNKKCMLWFVLTLSIDSLQDRGRKESSLTFFDVSSLRLDACVCQTASVGFSSQHMTSELDRIELESR